MVANLLVKTGLNDIFLARAWRGEIRLRPKISDIVGSPELKADQMIDFIPLRALVFLLIELADLLLHCGRDVSNRSGVAVNADGLVDVRLRDVRIRNSRRESCDRHGDQEEEWFEVSHATTPGRFNPHFSVM